MSSFWWSGASKVLLWRDAGGWACGRLASWWGKSLPRRRSVAGLRGRAATLGLRTAQTPTGGSSEEFSAMGATLTEQRRVQEDGLRIVNCFSGGRGNKDGTPGRSPG